MRENGWDPQNIPRKLWAKIPKHWDRYFDHLLFAYHEVSKNSTNFNPFKLLWSGRDPLEILKETWTNQTSYLVQQQTGE